MKYLISLCLIALLSSTVYSACGDAGLSGTDYAWDCSTAKAATDDAAIIAELLTDLANVVDATTTLSIDLTGYTALTDAHITSIVTAITTPGGSNVTGNAGLVSFSLNISGNTGVTNAETAIEAYVAGVVTFDINLSGCTGLNFANLNT